MREASCARAASQKRGAAQVQHFFLLHHFTLHCSYQLSPHRSATLRKCRTYSIQTAPIHSVGPRERRWCEERDSRQGRAGGSAAAESHRLIPWLDGADRSDRLRRGWNKAGTVVRSQGEAETDLFGCHRRHTMGKRRPCVSALLNEDEEAAGGGTGSLYALSIASYLC